MTGSQRATTGIQENSDASSRRTFLRAATVAGVGALTGCVSAGGSEGKELTVGYQPYYTESWSALIVKHADLAEKFLPEGYSVDEWQAALQGSIIGQRMITGKNQIGYAGDMPSITAIASDERDIAVVGLAGYSPGQQCNLAVVPNGSEITGVEDLDGKTFAVTTGACAHRFLLRFAAQEGIDIQIRDTGINTILSGLREGSVDVGIGWEPNMYKTVHQLDEGRYVLTGVPYDLYDGAGLIMPDELLEDDQEAAKQWLKAELEAKHIMATQPQRTVDLVSQEDELESYSRSTLRGCLYENVSSVEGADRMTFETDYRAAEPAETLLEQRGPRFLKQQGILEETPRASRYKTDTLSTAIDELADEVEWTVHRAAEGGQ
ncbi:MAG: ABC-type nitrate/sulfonate/bicarbonate transport system substrate-binding protein [Halobacteriales archaeon]|jgi:ABC-type nitrate/sulfonate/bicarbonate transport system substrate-binding protein